MIVIAKTDDGVLIEATKKELQEIICSVTGKIPEDIVIGQKIPAIDYASTIQKVKALGDSYEFKAIFENLDLFIEEATGLQQVVNNAKNIEL